jgi:transposase
LTHHVESSSIKGGAVVEFLEQVAQQGDDRPTVVVLDNAPTHHAIDPEVHERWLRDDRMQLFYLAPYSPELNLIEIVWKQAKYRWRHFVTWTKDTTDDEVRNLLGAYRRRKQSCHFGILVVMGFCAPD